MVRVHKCCLPQCCLPLCCGCGCAGLLPQGPRHSAAGPPPVDPQLSLGCGHVGVLCEGYGATAVLTRGACR